MLQIPDAVVQLRHLLLVLLRVPLGLSQALVQLDMLLG